MAEDSNLDGLKREYIEYFEDVPVQKYAAMAIGRDEDTIIRWRKDDVAFADAVMKAKARWIRKRMVATKAEFALERLESEIFSVKSGVLSDPAHEEIQDKLQAFMNDTDDNAYPA